MPRVGASGARLAVTRDRRAGSDHCRCTDSQGSVRMFAYHLCETPPLERTADAFEAHSVSVGGSPNGDDICPLEDVGLFRRGRLFCPGLTPIAAQLGDWLAWTDGRRADGRGRRIPVVRLAVRSG